MKRSTTKSDVGAVSPLADRRQRHGIQILCYMFLIRLLLSSADHTSVESTFHNRHRHELGIPDWMSPRVESSNMFDAVSVASCSLVSSEATKANQDCRLHQIDGILGSQAETSILIRMMPKFQDSRISQKCILLARVQAENRRWFILDHGPPGISGISIANITAKLLL